MTTVLVVEDQPLNRSLLRDLLELSGYAVVEAENVTQAWEVLCSQVVNLIVMDIQIPGGGGEFLLKRLRSDERFATLPVLAVTAYAMRGDRERLLEEGFDDYLPKPIDTRAFPEVVARCLARKGT